MNNQIELRPLQYRLKPTLIGQINKCEEEYKEFLMAVMRGDVTNSIEEFYDVIQIMLNTLRLLDIPIECVVKGQLDHFTKLENRGWNFENE